MNTGLNTAQFCKLAHIFITIGAPCGLIRVGDEIRSKPVVIETQKIIQTFTLDQDTGLWLYGERIVPFTQDEQLAAFFTTGNFLPGVGRNTMIERLVAAGFVAREKSKFVLTEAGKAQHIETVRRTNEIQAAREAAKNAKAQAKIAANILLMQAAKAAKTTVAA